MRFHVPENPRRVRVAAAWVLWLAAMSLSGLNAPAQISTGIGTTQQQSRTVRGRVVNALTGVGIARALVNLNTRQLLTDAQGRFEFPQVTDDRANVLATRPGFSSSADSSMPNRQQIIANLDQPILVRLYPDAVVTGFVTGSDGLPLAGLQVLLRRLNLSGQGQRWINTDFATTNSRGEYRIQTGGGRFRLNLNYMSRMRETGLAVSPVSYPESSGGGPGSYFALGPGEERHVDLRPRTGDAYPVQLKVDLPDARSGLRFTVTSSDGNTFQPGFATNSSPGEYLLTLPSGNYTVHAHADTREDSFAGSARVTVAGHAVNGVALHLAPATSLPVEIRVDQITNPISSQPVNALSGSSATVDARQLNLSLRDERDDGPDIFNPDQQLRQLPDKSYEFRLQPGRYRLQGSSFSPWYVLSATYGTSDLLTGDIVVGPGAGGQVIRLAVSNQRGRVKGHVSLPESVAGAWIYLLPQQPSLASPLPIYTAPDGSFVAWLPIGSYEVIAVDQQLEEDLADRGVFPRLGLSGKPVAVAADTEVPLEVDLGHAKVASR